MVDKIEKLAPVEVAKLAEQVFGLPVERVTAPGVRENLLARET